MYKPENFLASRLVDRHNDKPEEGREKIFLPRRQGESHLKPQQYWYLASKGGAVPWWSIPTRQRSDASGTNQFNSSFIQLDCLSLSIPQCT
jgi:hypothetical protein